MILDNTLSRDGVIAAFAQMDIYNATYLELPAASGEYVPEYIGYPNTHADIYITMDDDDPILLIQKNLYDANGNLTSKVFTRDDDGSLQFKTSWTNRAASF